MFERVSVVRRTAFWIQKNRSTSVFFLSYLTQFRCDFRFSVKVLQSLCEQTENRPVAGLVVIGNGQAARAVSLAGTSMQLPVLWAKGGVANLHGTSGEVSIFCIFRIAYTGGGSSWNCTRTVQPNLRLFRAPHHVCHPHLTHICLYQIGCNRGTDHFTRLLLLRFCEIRNCVKSTCWHSCSSPMRFQHRNASHGPAGIKKKSNSVQLFRGTTLDPY